MSNLRENIPFRLGRKMNVIKEVACKKEKKLENKFPTEDKWDDGQVPSISSDEEIKDQQQNNDVNTIKTHRRSGQHISFFRPLPSPPNILHRTFKCEPFTNNVSIVIDAANGVDQQSSDDSEQDVVGAQPQRMQPEQQQIQQEQPQSTDVSSKVGECPGKAANEDEPKFDGFCDACFYYTIKCCDIFGMI